MNGTQGDRLDFFFVSIIRGHPAFLRALPSLRWQNEDSVSVVPDSAATMLSEGGKGCSVKWGKKQYYSNVVVSGTCKKKITTTNYSMIIIRNKSALWNWKKRGI